MADSGKLFIISAISREGIAEALNDYLEGNEAATSDRLAPDDDRLTDEICQAYADGLSNLDEDLSESEQEEYFCELDERTLNDCGIDCSLDGP